MHPLEADDPQFIGAYRLLGRIGAGGMGRVYLGRSSGGRTVAVKVVHPHFALDEQFRARFRREVQSARRVGGEWTAPVLDADPEARVPWVATGYVAGPSLSQAVTEQGPLPEPTVRALGAGLAEALTAVHALGLVHRDVKPSNVMLTLDGPRLIDFGIARATDGTASLTSTGVSVGSPGYMSPEQILGKGATGAADVFSLGAVLTYAATGVAPFSGDSSAALLYKVVHEEAVIGPELTGDLRDLVSACLAKDPADRPAPERIVRRLAAADGASGLVRSGWLPAAVVERASRQAVELLDLDATPPGPAVGAFGPPDASYASGGGTGLDTGFGADAPAPAFPRPGDPREAPAEPRQAGHTTGHVAGHVAEHGAGHTTGHDGGDGPRDGERRVAVSAAIGGRNRPKALSCTLVLSVAGVLAAATTVLFVFDVLPGDGGDTTAKGGADASHSAGPSSPGDGGTAGSPSAGAGPSSVPKPFLGTWSGTIVKSSDGQPNGTLTVTITKGGKGDRVADLVYDFAGVQCHSRGTLTSLSAKKLTAREKGYGKIPEVAGIELCTRDTATVTFTDRGEDGLRFTSDDAGGGKPAANLTRNGG